jgi:hypothetical protein
MVNYCLVVPLLPGKIELSKKFEEENGGNNKEHDEFYKTAGVTREQVWIQRSPAGSGAPDLEIVSLETEDPAKTLKEFSTSNHPWAIRFRKFAKEAFGIDFEAGPPPPLNELLVDWYEKK